MKTTTQMDSHKTSATTGSPSLHIPHDVWRHVRSFVSDQETALALRLVCTSSVFPPLSRQKQRALQWAAECGDATSLLRLLETFELTSSDARADDNLALRSCAYCGHVAVLRCLKADFGLTALDARTMRNLPLKLAASNGQVEALRCLKNEFGLTGADARSENNAALQLAACNGHVKVLQCLKNDFGLSSADTLANSNWAWCRAVAHGHEDVLQCLKNDFQSTATTKIVCANQRSFRCFMSQRHKCDSIISCCIWLIILIFVLCAQMI